MSAQTPFTLSPILFTQWDTSFFVDRERELELVRRAIKSDRSALVWGPRGSGKSSFLNFVNVSIQEQGILVAKVELTDLPKDPYEAFVILMQEVIAEAQRKSAENPGWTQVIQLNNVMPRVQLPVSTPDIAFAHPLDIQSAILRMLEAISRLSNLLLVLVDEIHVRGRPLLDSILRLRDHIWKSRLRFVFAGDDATAKLVQKSPVLSPFFALVELQNLSGSDLYRSLENRIKKQHAESFDLDKKVVDDLARHCAGDIRSAIQTLAEASAEGRSLKDVGLKLAGSLIYRQALDMHPTKRRVLQKIYEKQSVTLTDPKLSEELKITRVRLSQIINELINEGLVVVSRREGRSTIVVPAHPAMKNVVMKARGM